MKKPQICLFLVVSGQHRDLRAKGGQHIATAPRCYVYVVDMTVNCHWEIRYWETYLRCIGVVDRSDKGQPEPINKLSRRTAQNNRTYKKPTDSIQGLSRTQLLLHML